MFLARWGLLKLIHSATTRQMGVPTVDITLDIFPTVENQSIKSQKIIAQPMNSTLTWQEPEVVYSWNSSGWVGATNGTSRESLLQCRESEKITIIQNLLHRNLNHCKSPIVSSNSEDFSCLTESCTKSCWMLRCLNSSQFSWHKS